MEKRRMTDRYERTYNGISIETFRDFDNESKLNTLFDIAIETHLCGCENTEAITELRSKMAKSRKVDTAFAGSAGLIGGFLAQAFKAVFKF